MLGISARNSLLAIARLLGVVVMAFALAAQPVRAQSILRDAETEAVLKEMARPLIVAAGLQPANVDIILVGDNQINAFVAGGQAVYINSGLITAADNANQVQGVIAHELGHVTGGHIVRFDEGAKAATNITLLSLLIGAAAMAAGAGDAGMAALMAGQQAAMGKFLAFTRTQEASADAAGVQFLRKAGISGKGSLQFFRKLKFEEFRLSSSYADTDPYALTHPMSSDRIANMEADYKASPYWETPTPPDLEAKFQRVRAKLLGYIEEPKVVLAKYPESDQSQAALYARSYAWHRSAYPERAFAEADKLVATAPHDPYFLELKGQILLESGKPKEAIAPLREATDRSGNAPLIAALLGHALIATEDPKYFDEARKVLRIAVARDNDNPFAWYQLGIVYDREGDKPRAALATAERYSMTGEPRLALGSAEQAMAGIPVGTSDYLRAQDIAMASRAQMEQERKRKK